MENHLRLAESRGSLKAPNSAVQDLALRMLRVLDDKRAVQADQAALKRTLLTSNVEPQRLFDLFPMYFSADWVKQQALDKAKGPDGQIDVDLLGADADWGVASEDEDKMLNQWISQREGSATAADLTGGWV